MSNNATLLKDAPSAVDSLCPETIPNPVKKPESDEILENTLLNIGIDNGLTRREAEILNLILAGNTNKEMSQKICRSERTIEYHRNRLMRKLGTKNAAELVKCALAMGIV